MRAALLHAPHDLRVEDRPDPTCGPGEVVVEVTYNGLCGTDATEYTKGPMMVPLTSPHPGSGHVGPTTLGHEFIGVVVEAGLRQSELLAVRIERGLQLIAVHPPFFAARHADLEPIRAPHQKLDLLAPLGDEEDRIARTRTRVQIDIGVCDGDLPIVPFRACCRSCDEKLA